MRARFVRVAADQLAAADGQQRRPAHRAQPLRRCEPAATLDRVEPTGNGYVWVGRVPSVALSTVTLASARGMMYGSILTPAATYIVKPAGGGDYLVTQIDQSRFPPEAPPVTLSAAPALDAAQAPRSR